jgi:transglutaminase-like putative cysteine protease
MKLKAFLLLFLYIGSFNLPAQELHLENIDLKLPPHIKLEAESWYKISFLNQEVGYYFTHLYESVWEDQDVLVHYGEICINVDRFSQKLENRIIILTILTADLDTLCIIYQQYVSYQEPLFKQCDVRENCLELTKITQGLPETVTYELPENFATEVQIILCMLQSGLEAGFKKSYVSFDMENENFQENTVEILGKKQVDFKGVQQTVTRVRTINKHQSLTLDTEDWLDIYGNMLFSVEKTTGLTLERGNKEDLLNKTAYLDLNSFSINIDEHISRPEDVRFLKLKVSEHAQFIEDQRQRHTVHNGEHYLEIVCPPFSDEDSLKLPLSAGGVHKQDLESNKYIQADNQDIVSLARDIVGQEKNAWRACRKIARWLHDNIKPSFRMAFLSAAEVLKKKEGDCTEFAVLFAALARAAGVPAKVNIGLVYYDNQFFYHAWNEVFVGEWVSIDTALYQFEVDATHLKMYSGDLSALNEVYVKIMKSMGNMKIEIVEYR